MATEASHIRVRMYRQGLGDCFLVSVLGPSRDRPFHMMIDCGVILGTPDAVDRLRAVVRSVIEETGGHVDVLAVTHEHYDHVSGFVLARELFAGPEEVGAAGRLTVGEVWFAWTEDPTDPFATALREERATQLRALSAMALRLGSAAAHQPELVSALSFFGVNLNGNGLGATAQAMQNAARLAPDGRVRYLRPGATLAPDGVPELRFRVLGPPTSRASLFRADARSELYRIDAVDLVAVVRLAATDGAAVGDGGSPFGPGWALPLAGLADEKDPRAGFFRRHYLDGSQGDKGEGWRGIDGAWLASADSLALALDGATNNTSLVLAIECVASHQVLLFAADAQVGNWLSWQDLRWQDLRWQGQSGPEDGGVVTAADLLGRTVFYKVGHHGSDNATLRTRGLELMPSKGLVAFLPVDEAMAKKKRWNAMPFPALVAALRERCGDHLVRADQEPPASIPDLSTGGSGVAYGSLYVDWTLPQGAT